MARPSRVPRLVEGKPQGYISYGAFISAVQQACRRMPGEIDDANLGGAFHLGVKAMVAGTFLMGKQMLKGLVDKIVTCFFADKGSDPRVAKVVVTLYRDITNMLRHRQGAPRATRNTDATLMPLLHAAVVLFSAISTVPSNKDPAMLSITSLARAIEHEFHDLREQTTHRGDSLVILWTDQFKRFMARKTLPTTAQLIEVCAIARRIFLRCHQSLPERYATDRDDVGRFWAAMRSVLAETPYACIFDVIKISHAGFLAVAYVHCVVLGKRLFDHSAAPNIGLMTVQGYADLHRTPMAVGAELPDFVYDRHTLEGKDKTVFNAFAEDASASLFTCPENTFASPWSADLWARGKKIYFDRHKAGKKSRTKHIEADFRRIAEGLWHDDEMDSDGTLPRLEDAPKRVAKKRARDAGEDEAEEEAKRPRPAIEEEKTCVVSFTQNTIRTEVLDGTASAARASIVLIRSANLALRLAPAGASGDYFAACKFLDACQEACGLSALGHREATAEVQGEQKERFALITPRVFDLVPLDKMSPAHVDWEQVAQHLFFCALFNVSDALLSNMYQRDGMVFIEAKARGRNVAAEAATTIVAALFTHKPDDLTDPHVDMCMRATRAVQALDMTSLTLAWEVALTAAGLNRPVLLWTRAVHVGTLAGQEVVELQ